MRWRSQFLAEYDQKCAAQQDHAPETADDYLDLAEQATSKKKHMEYLRKALELEPDNLDARLQMITCTTEHHLDEQRLALAGTAGAGRATDERSRCI